MNESRLLRTAIILCSAWVCASAAAHAAVPEILLAAIEKPPVVDGKLTDECWKTAAVIERFSLYADPQGGTSDRTKVYAGFDSAWLYLGFDCVHPYPERIETVVTQHDGPVHRDESLEIFLDPGTDGDIYFHFILNAANVRAEQRVTRSAGPDRGWNQPWRSATGRTGRGWQAEVAIPLYVLAAHGDLSLLRMNVFRNAQIPQVDQQGVRVGTVRASGGWSAVQKSYHEPDRFGKVLGIAGPWKVPFVAGLEEAAVGGYVVEGGRYVYRVTTGVAGFTPEGGSVVVEAVDEPVSGAPSSRSQTVSLAGTERRQVTIPVPVAAPVERSVRVRMLNPLTGEVLAERRVGDTSVLNLMSAYLNQTYYTTEKQATAVCTFGLPADDLKSAVLRVRGGPRRAVLGEASRVTPETRVSFRIDTLPAQIQTVLIELSRKSGETLCTREMELIKRPPKPGSEVKVDRINLRVLKDGKPVFPFGYVMYGVPGSREEIFREIAEAGFNAVMHWCFMPPEGGKLYQEVCQKYGLLVVNDITRYGGPNLIHVKGEMVGAHHLSKEERSRIFREAYEKALPGILKGIELVKDFPNLLCYYSFDEPFGPEFLDMYLQGQDLYRRANELDGYHPTYVFYHEKEAVGWTDIIGTDPYWVPAGLGERGTVNLVSRSTRFQRRRGEVMRMPVWMVPTGEFWSGMDKRMLLPEENYCQTYLAIIHGAKGLFYFKYRPFHLLSWQGMTRLAREMKVIGPIAVTPDIPQEVTYSPGTYDMDEGRFPDVQVNLRRGPDGRYVLLAANSRSFPVDVAYTVEGLGSKGKVSRHFDPAEYLISKNSFSERLEPLATRAYILPAGTKLAEPVRIMVAMTPRPEMAVPEPPCLPRTGRAGKRNLVRNPGFEEAVVPLVPDYYRPTMDFGRAYTGTPDASWTQDTDRPFEGKACLRLKDRFGFQFFLAPQNLEPKQYVFSVYLRADRDGMKVHLTGPENREVVVTGQWRRYSLPVVIPARASEYTGFGVQPLEEGTLWADAAQVETGREPTDYEP